MKSLNTICELLCFVNNILLIDEHSVTSVVDFSLKLLKLLLSNETMFEDNPPCTHFSMC